MKVHIVATSCLLLFASSAFADKGEFVGNFYKGNNVLRWYKGKTSFKHKAPLPNRNIYLKIGKTSVYYHHMSDHGVQEENFKIVSQTPEGIVAMRSCKDGSTRVIQMVPGIKEIKEYTIANRGELVVERYHLSEVPEMVEE